MQILNQQFYFKCTGESSCISKGGFYSSVNIYEFETLSYILALLFPIFSAVVLQTQTTIQCFIFFLV